MKAHKIKRELLAMFRQHGAQTDESITACKLVTQLAKLATRTRKERKEIAAAEKELMQLNLSESQLQAVLTLSDLAKH